MKKIFSLIMLVLFALTGVFSSYAGTDSDIITDEAAEVKVLLSSNKNTYKIREQPSFTLEITNNSDQEVSMLWGGALHVFGDACLLEINQVSLNTELQPDEIKVINESRKIEPKSSILLKADEWYIRDRFMPSEPKSFHLIGYCIVKIDNGEPKKIFSNELKISIIE